MRSKEGGRTFTEGARRAQIVRVAIELIADVGYPKASVRRIAERVGVAMSVVLYHFENKDELVSAIVAELYRLAIATVLPAVRAETTQDGRVRAYIRSNLEFVRRYRTEHSALLDIGLTYRSADGRRVDALEVDAEIRRDLTELDLTGLLRGLVPKPELTSVILRSALNGTVLEMQRDPGFDLAAYGEELVAMVVPE